MIKIKEIYAVINDNYGSVEDRIEFLFLNEEDAKRYAKEMQKDSSRNNYDVITLYLLEEGD